MPMSDFLLLAKTRSSDPPAPVVSNYWLDLGLRRAHPPLRADSVWLANPRHGRLSLLPLLLPRLQIREEVWTLERGGGKEERVKEDTRPPSQSHRPG